MGSCSSIKDNQVKDPQKPRKHSSIKRKDSVNTYPSIEDVIQIERMKNKKNVSRRNSRNSRERVDSPQKTQG